MYSPNTWPLSCTSHHVHIKKLSPLFLEHVICYWVAANPFPLAVSSIISMLCPLSAPHKTKTDQPTHIHPENGNCNVCHNVGQLLIFDTHYTQKLKFYIMVSQEN
jgi:hypothetical protein